MNFKHAIWIRTPKTAGTSIDFALRDYLVRDEACADEELFHFEESPPQGYVFPEGKIICLAPNTASEIPRFISIHKKVWTESFKFAIVRNPYDRFVSGWKYLASTRDKSLRDVILNPPESGPAHVQLTMLQSDFLGENSVIYSNLHFLRFEKMQDDIDRLSVILGIERIILSTMNKTTSKDRHFSEYYSSETKALVARRYEIDFENFGYGM